MKAARRTGLAEMDASAFLPALPGDLVGSIALEGFTLQPRTKPVLSPDGRVHVRLVWRRRETGSCVVVQWSLRGAVGDELLDALDAALYPTDGACHG